MAPMSYALLASLIIDQLGMAFFQHYNLCINMGLTLIIIIGAAALVKLLRIWAPGLLPSIAGIRK